MDEGLERKIKNDFEKLKDDLEEIEEKHHFLVENLSAKECAEY